jgi:hypothetical protein
MIKDDGTFTRDDKIAGLMQKFFDGVTIDTFTGAITYVGGHREIWSIAQSGNSQDDYVLVFPPIALDRGSKEAARAGATEFIRLRDWPKRPHVKFSAFAFDLFVSGTCEVVM